MTGAKVNASNVFQDLAIWTSWLVAPAAYDVTHPGKIVFDPSQSALLQSAGAKTIAIGATRYSSVSLVQSLIAVPTPQIKEVVLSGGSQLTFTFTNYSGLSFSALATNNISAPRTTWPVIGTAIESPAGSGNYQFNDPNPTTNSSLYYILRQP